MKRRNAAIVMLLALALEFTPWCLYLDVAQADGSIVRQYYSCLSTEPASLGIVTPSATLFLTCILMTLSIIYWRTMHRGASLAMLILDVVAAIAVLGTLLTGVTPVSAGIMLLLTAHFLLILQARRI